MSFRRLALETAGGFSAEMARTGRHPLGVDDTEACIRVRRIFPGSILLYAPEARARHRVPAARESLRYFCTRCFAEGRAKAALTTVVAGLLLTTTGYVAGMLQASWRRAVRPRRSADPAVELETERTLS